MMTLKLIVSSAPPESTIAGQQMDIPVAGATLGRGAGNSIILPDNERIVSSLHASISQKLGQFVITDHSTNGTFINNGAKPLGPNKSVPLNDGDSITIGKYCLQVQLVALSQKSTDETPTAKGASFLDELSVAPPASPIVTADSSETDDFDKWLEPMAPARQQDPLWGSSNVLHPSLEESEEHDPLAAIDQARQSDMPLDPLDLDEDPDWWKGSHQDHVPAVNQAFEIPRPVSSKPPSEPVPPITREATPVPAIDDASDLDALLGLSPSAADADTTGLEEPIEGAHILDALDGAGDMSPAFPPASGMSQPPQAASAEPQVRVANAIPLPVAIPAAAPSAGGNQDAGHTLAQLLDLGQLDARQLEALTPEVATVLRETVIRLLEMLRARSSIKNELRLDRTMIQPLENNPLKFALTDKDALRYLFGEHSGAYLSGSRAVKEAFADVADHQLALLAGMRSAYEQMLAKFSPESLEKRFGDSATKGLLSNKKSRLWDAYQEYFVKLQEDPETSYNKLFGQEFASAYEVQIESIKSNKRKNEK